MAKAKKNSVPVVITIAGSDNSGGAGIQADLKTMTTLGVYGTTAVTCVVSEHPGKVKSIHAISTPMVREQIELICEAFPVTYAKCGMLYSEAIIKAVAEVVKKHKLKLVVDPVMVATSGALLLKPSAVKALKEYLLPLACLVTPNLDEAQILAGRKIINLDELVEATQACVQQWKVPFLIKGGHLKLKDSVDVLCDGKDTFLFVEPTIKGVSTHGTGCTYSAAITAGLAHGLSLNQAIVQAKGFITRAIREHFVLGRYQALNHLP